MQASIGAGSSRCHRVRWIPEIGPVNQLRWTRLIGGNEFFQSGVEHGREEEGSERGVSSAGGVGGVARAADGP